MEIYFDHNATTPLDPRVLETMLPYFRDCFGNPSSLHSYGQKARKAVETAREKVASLFSAPVEGVIFTGSCTEAINLFLKGYARLSPNRRFLTSSIEHGAVLATLHSIKKDGLAEVFHVPVDGNGVIKLDELKRLFNSGTALVTVMHSNNETGTLQPVREIAQIAREHRAIFATDATQSIGKAHEALLEADILFISAHKIGGPKGAGALIMRRDMDIPPLLHGGHQERGRRGGTENVASIVGFARALELVFEEYENRKEKMRRLRDRFESGVLSLEPAVKINGSGAPRLPNTSNLIFPGVEGRALVIALNLEGIAASHSSACTSGGSKASHVLKMMGFEGEELFGGIRFSFGVENTEEEVDRTLEILPGALRAAKRYEKIFAGKAGYSYEECFTHPISI